MEVTKWWSDWQDRQHAVSFDFRAAMPVGTLVREYESFSDVILLNRTVRNGATSIVEIGCATGEFVRYLKRTNPGVRYCGLDVSEAAILRAKEKYPEGRFLVVSPDTRELGRAMACEVSPEIVYSKDVMHHQVRPLEFLSELLRVPDASVILRCRTRDVGTTEWDPELSCQYHYKGWMPYVVINVQELIDYIHGAVPEAEIVVMRNYMILGGVQSRFLPKDCYLPQTGTAETAIGVFQKSKSPGTVRFEDRPDSKPRYTIFDRIWFGSARVTAGFAGKQKK